MKHQDPRRAPSLLCEVMTAATPLEVQHDATPTAPILSTQPNATRASDQRVVNTFSNLSSRELDLDPN